MSSVYILSIGSKTELHTGLYCVCYFFVESGCAILKTESCTDIYKFAV